jgi:dimethylamine corrinoid protein
LSNEQTIFQGLREAVLSFEPDNVVTVTHQGITANLDPLKMIEEGLAKGLNEVGIRFERGELFLVDLIWAADAVNAGMELLKPLLPQSGGEKKLGRVIIGTVKGDIHDIGKKIVAAMLKASGFEVFDLGTDVSAELFIEKVKELHPDIVGMSALIATSMPEMENVIESIKMEGLRDKVKVLVGGSSVTNEYAERIGADGCGIDAVDAVNKAKALLKI